MPRFSLGKLVMARGIANEIKNNPSYKEEILDCLTRYLIGDWGSLCDEDKKSNELAIENNSRILAKYTTHSGIIYIITEWDRSYTTIMFTNEY